MKIRIIRAAGGEVTGSAYYVQTKKAAVPADCGLFQSAPRKPRVVLTHGEDEPRQVLAQKIQQRLKLKLSLPEMGEVIEL